MSDPLGVSLIVREAVSPINQAARGFVDIATTAERGLVDIATTAEREVGKAFIATQDNVFYSTRSAVDTIAATIDSISDQSIYATTRVSVEAISTVQFAILLGIGVPAFLAWYYGPDLIYASKELVQSGKISARLPGISIG